MNDSAKSQAPVAESDSVVCYVSFFRHGDHWRAQLWPDPPSGFESWRLVLPVPRVLRKDPLPGTVTLGPQHQV